MNRDKAKIKVHVLEREEHRKNTHKELRKYMTLHIIIANTVLTIDMVRTVKND